MLWPLLPDSSVPAHPSAHLAETASDAPVQSPLEPPLAPHPVVWGDWPRCHLRRSFIRLLRTQTVELAFSSLQLHENQPEGLEVMQTRAQRAHSRLSWKQRMSRNDRLSQASPLTITLYGLPAALALYLQRSLPSAA